MIVRLIYWTELPREEEAKKRMNDEDFREYVKDNGYHFSNSLADKVTKHMKNADKTSHNWTSAQVKEALQTIPEGYTQGDASYLANMAYADFYPAVLKTEQECLKYAQAMMNDPDGYEEVAFSRWLADYIFEKEYIDWDEFN